MKVDLYEKIWMWGVGVMLALFFTSTAVAAFHDSMNPPSHVETIDPRHVMQDARFRAPGVSTDELDRFKRAMVQRLEPDFTSAEALERRRERMDPFGQAALDLLQHLCGKLKEALE